VEIKFYTDDVRKMWDDYVYTHPQGTFFHLIGWKRVIETTFGYQPWYIYAEDHGTITGVLPLFAVKKPVFGVRLVSVPFGVYGGLCAQDANVEALLLEQAKQLTQEIGADCLELRHAVTNGHELPVKSLYVTFQRPLYADEEENLQAIPRKQRRMVRQGAKYDLQTKMGDNADLQGFYEVYAQSLHNLGTPAFPRRYFHALREEFGEQCQIAYVIFDDGDFTSEDRAKFRASRTGWQFGGVIVLLDGDQKPWSIVIDRLSNIVRLEQGETQITWPRSKDELLF